LPGAPAVPDGGSRCSSPARSTGSSWLPWPAPSAASSNPWIGSGDRWPSRRQTRVLPPAARNPGSPATPSGRCRRWQTGSGHCPRRPMGERLDRQPFLLPHLTLLLGIDTRQKQVRGMRPIMKDAIDGRDEVLPPLLRDGAAGVAVAVEAW